MSKLLAFLCGLALATLLAAHAPPAPSVQFGTRHPDAPPETDQFAFLVGEWRCTTRDMQPDGTLADGPEARWTGYWILDGWAIQDDWEGPSGRGTNIRSFDPETRVWDTRWLANTDLRWKHYSARRVGETMVMTGGEGVDARGRAYLDRNVFHDIGARSWGWRKDRSYDGGETWVEGVAVIEAERVR